MPSNWVVWLFITLASIFIFSASYAGVTWWQVRGLRGLAMVFLFLALSLICSATAWSYASAPRISIFASLAVLRSAWTVAGLCAFVLADTYAASKNHHKAITTILYLAFISLSRERNRDAGV